MKTIPTLLIALLLAPLAALHALEVANLRCEHMSHPLGMDVARPRLSWVIEERDQKPEARGQKQTAYQILVASSEELLKQDKGDLWDSGKVLSDQSIAVRYDGKPLVSENCYWWKVRVYDKNEKPSAWSKPAIALTGKMQPEDWHGKWIGANLAPRGSAASEKPAHTHGAIYLRKEFDLTKPVARAVLSFSGLGFSEVAIDGNKVGNYVIGPGFTDYEHRVQYLSFDVSERFKTPGKKKLDVTLVDGWYALSKDPWVHKLEKKPYVDLPKLILDLRLIHTDGSETVVTSDESWKWSTGEITRSWIAGEDIDLRLVGEDARMWQPVIPVAAPKGLLQHQKEPFNRIVEEVKPVSMKYDPASKSCVWDLGRTINGWVRFKAKGPAGTQMRITTIPSVSGEGAPRPQTWTSLFTLSGSGMEEVYEPRFFHAGMRHVKITGLSEEPAITDLVGCQVSSMHTPAGGFRCSDETVTAIHDSVRRTVVSYTTFLPNDPMREWKAWTQDIQNMFGSAFYLFAESQVMYERWQQDLVDSQRADGNMANVAPGPVFDPYNSPWWGGCGVWLPWEWRLAYGDESLLKESYPAMKRYVDFLAAAAAKDSGLQKWGLLDWLAIEETPIALINTPAHYHYARIVSCTAERLGLPDDAKKYAAMAESVKDTVNHTFLDPTTGIYGEKGWKIRKGNSDVPGGLERLHSVWWDGDRPCTQAGQVMPLALGMVPDAARPAVEAALLREIAAHKDHLSTGFVSTTYLLDILMDLAPEVGWHLTTTREFPSWYGMTLGSGNDLMKETWSGGAAIMPSLGGNFARWCYRGLGGIRPDESAPGFKKIIIKPAIVGDLKWVECWHDSNYGRIVSNWKREGDKLTMEVTIPPNTTATVFVPAKVAAAMTEGGNTIDKVEGVKFLRMENSIAVYVIASGTYHFQSTLTKGLK